MSRGLEGVRAAYVELTARAGCRVGHGVKVGWLVTRIPYTEAKPNWLYPHGFLENLIKECWFR